jgi:hypothetical protein
VNKGFKLFYKITLHAKNQHKSISWVVASKQLFGHKWIHPQSCGCIHSFVWFHLGVSKSRHWLRPTYMVVTRCQKIKVWMQPSFVWFHLGASMPGRWLQPTYMVVTRCQKKLRHGCNHIIWVHPCVKKKPNGYNQAVWLHPCVHCLDVTRPLGCIHYLTFLETWMQPT